MIVASILLIAFFLLGVLIYYVDLWVMSKLKNKKGLLIGHSLLWRAIVAVLIILLLELKLTHGTGGVQEKIAYSILEWVGIVLGFYLARHFIKWAPGKLKKIIQYAKDAEAGNVNPLNDLKSTLADSAQHVARHTTEKKSADFQKDKIVPQENTTTSAHEKKEEDIPKEEISFEEKIKKFTEEK